MADQVTAKSTTISATSPLVPESAKVVEIKEEAYAIATYALVFEDEATRNRFQFQPGQFNALYLAGIGEVPISISTSHHEPQKLGHTIRYAGNVTRAISRLRVGDLVGLRGPYGNAWPLGRIHGDDLVIVTGGIGLAPLRPVIYAVIHDPARFGKVYLLYGARTPADMLYLDEMEAWRSHDIQIYTTVDRADPSWKGQVGVVPMLFYQIRLDPRRTTVLTCGPEIMMRFVVYEALARRISKDRIFISMERNMKCSVGLCGHCQFGPFFVCKEGPVFSYAQVEPFFGVEDF